jgi:hypothetical protein
MRIMAVRNALPHPRDVASRPCGNMVLRLRSNDESLGSRAYPHLARAVAFAQITRSYHASAGQIAVGLA